MFTTGKCAEFGYNWKDKDWEVKAMSLIATHMLGRFK